MCESESFPNISFLHKIRQLRHNSSRNTGGPCLAILADIMLIKSEYVSAMNPKFGHVMVGGC